MGTHTNDATTPTARWLKMFKTLDIPRSIWIVPLAALLVAACNSLEAPNFNFGDLEELQNNPTRASIGAAATGLTITTRKVYAEDDNDFVAMTGILGRETYVLDVADPRFVSEMLAGELNAGSPAFGGNYWGRPYENVRIADIVLTAVEAVPTTEVSEGEKAAARGFVKTWKALDLYVIAATRDFNCDGDLGCSVNVEDDPESLAPALPLRDVYTEIETLLDDGLTDLQNAGDAGFPFQLHSGFGAYGTPQTFQQFNRALAARIDVYIASIFGETGKYDEALQNLNDSFMSVGGDLEDGVYHVFSSGSGDVANGLFQPSPDPNFRAHPSFRDSARAQEDGALAGDRDGVTRDQRFLDKSRPVEFRTFQAVGSNIGFSLYGSIDSPVPIIRNEELILLAAEAHIGLDQVPQAEPFLNDVRTRSGGLPAADLSGATQEEALTEVLYDKKYSLWAEGGHHWIDLRRYDRLDDLPLDCPDADPETAINCPDTQHVRNAAYPVPLDEQLARGG
jgi:hypothetical protein